MSDVSSKAAGDRWWVSIGGESRGPYTSSEVGAMLASGEITDATFACAVGQSTWEPIIDLVFPDQPRTAWKTPPPPPDANLAGRFADTVPDVKQSAGTSSRPIGPSSPSTSASATPEGRYGNERTAPRLHEANPFQNILTDQYHNPRLWPMLTIFLVPWVLVMLWAGVGTQPSHPWGMTILGCVSGAALVWFYCRPNENDAVAGLMGFLAILFIGLPVLFTFQAVADYLAGINFFSEPPRGGAIRNPLLWIPFVIHQIGNAYIVSFDPEAVSSTSIFYQLFAMFISVAFCEEFLKIAPVLFLWVATEEQASCRAIVFVGACSGLGFGMAESIHYHYQVFTPENASYLWYLLRFISLPLLHCCWAALSATTFFLLKRDFFRDSESEPSFVNEAVVPVVAAMLVSMLAHTFYNVMLNHIPIVSIGIGALSVVATYWVFFFRGDLRRMADALSELVQDTQPS